MQEPPQLTTAEVQHPKPTRIGLRVLKFESLGLRVRMPTWRPEDVPWLGSWAASIRRMALLPLGASGRRSLREDAALPWREILAGAVASSSPVSIPLSNDAWLARSMSCKGAHPLRRLGQI